MHRSRGLLDGRKCRTKSSHGPRRRRSSDPPPPRASDRPLLALRRRKDDHFPNAAGIGPEHYDVGFCDDSAQATGRGRRCRLSLRRRRRIRSDDFDGRLRRMGPRLRLSLRHTQGPSKAALREGRDILFDIDWQGARQLEPDFGEHLVTIFLLPPSMEELEARLKAQRYRSAAVIEDRMKRAADEIDHWAEYEYVLVNHDMDRCLAQVRAIVAAERSKRFGRQISIRSSEILSVRTTRACPAAPGILLPRGSPGGGLLERPPLLHPIPTRRVASGRRCLRRPMPDPARTLLPELRAPQRASPRW